MFSRRRLNEETCPSRKHSKPSLTTDRPYAIIWLHGREIKLYEDDQGEFFTA